MQIKFVKEKETKNMVRFTEQTSPGKPPVIGTLYITKWFIGERIAISIEIAEEVN